MKLNKSELLTILSACKPAIAKKEFKIDLDNF